MAATRKETLSNGVTVAANPRSGCILGASDWTRLLTDYRAGRLEGEVVHKDYPGLWGHTDYHLTEEAVR